MAFSIFFKYFFDIDSCEGFPAFHDFFRGAGCNNGPSAVAALRSDVDNVICCLYDIEVVFDDDNGISAIGQAVQDVNKLVDICKMKPCGGLI